jgi:hypothetical protein
VEKNNACHSQIKIKLCKSYSKGGCTLPLLEYINVYLIILQNWLQVLIHVILAG